MMEIETEIISTQLIKPSVPTSPHLRYLQLSSIDQSQPLMAIPLLLFYPKSSQCSNTERCSIIKCSLSKALSIYYPFAGRLKDNNFIDCNDQGALLVVAKAKCTLSAILSHRNADVNKNFVARQSYEPGDFASSFQITLFSCGSLAISFALLHKLGDGASQFMFIKSWAEIAKGNTDNKTPLFGFSSLFPPTNFPGFKLTLPREKCVTKFFTFSGLALAALKAKYSATYGEKLSSVEALSVFIWSRFMASTQTKDRKTKRYTVRQWMNLRPKLQLPDSKICIGNLVTTLEVEADTNDTNDECFGIVKRMKGSIRSVDSSYIKKLQNGEQQLKVLVEIPKDVVCFEFSSMVNLSTYEADFGWGKPLHLRICPFIFPHSVFFSGTKDGSGIDAWIGLKEEDMAKFEADHQLLAYLSSTRFSRM